MITKVFSGYLSDYVGRRKPLAVLGYGVAALTKPIFPLATSLGWIVFARFVDRVGKGIRGAPRDALIADITPADLRGASFGLRQSLDTVGAVAGPLLAIAAMLWLADNFRLTFWLATLPAFAAVALLVFGVREPDARRGRKSSDPPLGLAEIRRLPARYWWVVGFAAMMTLSRFSEAFLVLRAQSLQMATAWIPLVIVVMSLVYALAALPAGVAADRGHQRALLVGGLIALIAADAVLAVAFSVPQVLAGSAIWGLHMGLTQGLLAALVAETAPAELRGTAFGFFNVLCGLALLIASGLAGWLWDVAGPRLTFGASAAFAAVSLAGLLAAGRNRRDDRGSGGSPAE
jgi:MFS family permease